MQFDINSGIMVLLYEHQTVSLPGLGSFVSNYKPANVDPVEGKIQPPSKQLVFNRNLLMDDGLLVQYLRKKYNVSYPTAMQAVEDYVKNAKAAIEKRDIFTITGVGRLYKDYEQNFQFLPDDVNFNTDSYGLPTVQFYPILRNQKEIPAQKGTASVADVQQVPTPAKKSTRKGVGKWLQHNVIAVSSVLLVGIALAVYFQFFYEPQPLQEALPTERVNVSPSSMTSDEQPESPITNDEDNSASDNASANDTEGITMQPGQKSCIIAIGMFGNQDNVERLVKQIFEAGYEPFTEKTGNLTRVGVQIAYKNEQDIQNTLKVIRAKFNDKAQVLKK
ncbi:MAG: hypothetical protein SFU99_03510 [Saprospiraceae bacterium]|nr:hypothetical protein [Saprospiraceae bacterium]